MPTFASFKDRAISAKNATAERAGNVKGRYTSASSSHLPLHPVARPPQPPPPPRGASRPQVPLSHHQEDAEPEEEYEEEAVQPQRIHWANITPADKEVFFGWLDEFFAGGPRQVPTRPDPVARNGNADAAPTKPPVPKALPPRASNYASPPPTPGNRPPPVNMASKPPPRPEHCTVGPPGSCLACTDFSAADAHAALFPRHTVRDLDELAVDLTEPFDSLAHKARAIFTWLHHNIAYDAPSFLAGNIKPSTPDSTLRSGLAVCEGYGGLFARLARAAQLEVIVVNGHGKGFGYAAPAPGAAPPAYSMGHAWNAVRLDDGAWQLIDSCWGAGALLPEGVFKQRFDPTHFTATNDEFGRRHFPAPREPEKQFVARPLTWTEYITMPPRPNMPADFGALGYAPELLRPAEAVLAPGRHTFVLKKTCAHARDNEADSYVPIMRCESAQGEPLVLQPNGAGWSITVDVRAGEHVIMAVVKIVNGADAFGIGRRAYEAARGRQSMSFGYLAEWDVV